MRWIIALAVLVGCDTPPFRLVYRLADGHSQSCAPAMQPAGIPVSCDQVSLACDAVLSVRVLKPSDPNAPYIPICEPVPKNDHQDLCGIAAIDLPATTIPKETLEVQVAVWARSVVEDVPTGTLDCRRYPVSFDSTDGFPVPAPGMPGPALGGRAFFHPGDDRVVVTLGCTDVKSVNENICIGATAVSVTATVEDFANHASVDSGDAALLDVKIGEPHPEGVTFVMRQSDVRQLKQTADDAPAWSADLELALTSSACIVVRDVRPETTTAVRCRAEEMGATEVNATGAWVAKDKLNQILSAIGRIAFPERGLTIGIVLDNSVPQAGFTVEAMNDPDTTIDYLTADWKDVSGTMTSDSGIFVVQNAPYRTTFRASKGPVQTTEEIGGLIEGMLTVVVLQVAPPGP